MEEDTAKSLDIPFTKKKNKGDGSSRSTKPHKKKDYNFQLDDDRVSDDLKETEMIEVGKKSPMINHEDKINDLNSTTSNINSITKSSLQP